MSFCLYFVTISCCGKNIEQTDKYSECQASCTSWLHTLCVNIFYEFENDQYSTKLTCVFSHKIVSMCCQYIILVSGNKRYSYLATCSKVLDEHAIDCAFGGFDRQADCIDKGCCLDISGSRTMHCFFPLIYNAGNAAYFYGLEN